MTTIESCPCVCHGGSGAFPPPCSVPGGCGPHDENRADVEQPAAPTASDACVISGKKHRRSPGLLICQKHLDELGRMLAEIEDEAILLEVAPSMAIGYDRSGGGLASESSPVRTTPSVILDRRRGTGMTRASQEDETAWDDTPSAIETLHSRARLVREERDLSTPTTTVILGRGRRPASAIGPFCERLCGHDSCGPWVTDVVRAPVTLTGERELLARHLPWIAEQAWVDELYDELRALLAALRRANSTEHLPAGVCGTLLSDGSQCEGKVWHVLIKPDGKVERADSRPPAREDEPGFRCGACRRVWTGTDAVRLRDRMWRDEQNRQTSSAGSAS